MKFKSVEDLKNEKIQKDILEQKKARVAKKILNRKQCICITVISSISLPLLPCEIFFTQSINSIIFFIVFLLLGIVTSLTSIIAIVKLHWNMVMGIIGYSLPRIVLVGSASQFTQIPPFSLFLTCLVHVLLGMVAAYWGERIAEDHY